MSRLPERYAGSISEGTLAARDLVPRFIRVLHEADPEHDLVIEWHRLEDALMTLADFDRAGYADYAEQIGFWESAGMNSFLNEELFDALCAVAPAGTYFGASEGDGASFGFWADPTCPECGQEGGNINCYYCTPDPSGGKDN